jgi:hypothetical protein
VHFFLMYHISNGNKTEGGHTCDPDGYTSGQGGALTKEMKKGIIDCLQNEIQRPSKIVAHFKKHGMDLPTRKQILNLKARLQDHPNLIALQPQDSSMSGVINIPIFLLQSQTKHML